MIVSIAGRDMKQLLPSLFAKAFCYLLAMHCETRKLAQLSDCAFGIRTSDDSAEIRFSAAWPRL